MQYHPHPIEPLEVRIAPAVSTLAFVDAHTATYTDTDGDHVTVKLSKGILTEANLSSVFELGAAGVGNYINVLQLVTPPEVAAAAKGTNITVSVKQAGDGDGLAVVGQISAAGLNLGTVKIQGDLSSITVGSGEAANVALRKLDVHTMGLYGDAVFGGASNIAGQLGALLVGTDLVSATINVFDHANESNGRIGSISIGGALAGNALIGVTGNIGTIHAGTILQTARILADGDIGAVTVPGGILRTSSVNPAISSSNGGIASLKIGGSTNGSAHVQAKHDIGPIKLTGLFAGLIESTAGKVGTVKVSGNFSGGILAATDMGAVNIGGDMTEFSGVAAGDRMASAKVGGSILDAVIQAQTLGPVTIKHDAINNLTGGAGHELIVGTTTITSIKIGGSLVSSMGSALITGQEAGAIRIGHDLDHAILNLSHLASLKVGGSITNGSQVAASNGIGSVNVGGNLDGQSSLYSSNAAIDSVNIGGEMSGQSVIQAHTKLGTIRIGRSLGRQSNILTDTGEIDTVNVGGSIESGSTISAMTDLQTLRVAGNLTKSTVRTVNGTIDSATIGGSIAVNSNIQAHIDLNALHVGGNVEMSIIQTDSGRIAVLTIGGSMRISAAVKAFTKIDAATIGGDLDSSSVSSGLAIASIKIGGSMIATPGGPTTAIDAKGDILSATLGGSMIGASILSEFGKVGSVKIGGLVVNSAIQSLLNMDSVNIGGDLIRSTILATGEAGSPVQIGAVSIHGMAFDSNILAGVKDNSNNGFGNNDDTLVASASTIGSINVGFVVSDAVIAKPIAFEAEEITSLKIGGHAIALQPGGGNDTINLTISPDYRLHEV